MKVSIRRRSFFYRSYMSTVAIVNLFHVNSAIIYILYFFRIVQVLNKVLDLVSAEIWYKIYGYQLDMNIVLNR